MTNKLLQTCLAVPSFALLIACGEKPSEPAPAAPAEPTAAPAPQAAPSPTPSAPPSVELPAVPEGAKVSFIEPTDGAKVLGPVASGKVNVSVKMGAEGITVKPAGAIEAGSGHHHILVDSEPEPEGAVVPKDDQHLHFGQGQTEATLALTPGEHTLRLQLADGIHRSYGPKLAAAIKITVAEGAASATAAAPGKAKAEPKHAAAEGHDKTHQH